MKYSFFNIAIVSIFMLTTQQVTVLETSKPTTHFEKVMKTGKERLGKKSSDEQRLNNCKVPIAERGSKPRPDACHRSKR